MTDIDVIREIENKLEINLKISNLEHLMYGKEFHSYALDNYHRVIGLNLYDSNLSDLTLIIKLTNLEYLNLGFNRLRDLTSIKELKSLTGLNLSDNLISDLSPIKVLKKLTHLYFWQNQLSNISALKELRNLIELNLGFNTITDLTPLSKLTNLRSLYLHYNDISDLAPLNKLRNLNTLYLFNNHISDIKPLNELRNLNSLSLSDNQISDLTPLKDLKNLNSLSLGNNPIRYLPKWIIDFNLEIQWIEYNSMGILSLYDNPLEQPPIEVVKQGKEAIKNYFEELRNQKTVQLYEAKLLVVGQGDVGKSWLMYRLINGKAPDSTVSTEGIQIIKWTINDAIKNADGTTSSFDINFWDFGGQEIYHSTHQFFLTKRSLYLFVWEARTDDDIIGFDYWLNVIRLLSDNAPVIVVMNKCDERTKEIDGKSIQDKFPNVKRFFSVSASRGDGIEDLKNEIVREITQLPLVGNTLPKVWTDIRKELEQHDKNYISYKEYCAICQHHGLEQERADHLSKYYHDLGVFLYFGDNMILRDRVFLKPDWATKAVYKILDQEEVKTKKGKFSYKELKIYWREYDEQEYKYLLELMQKFELCFKLRNQQTYIVPELLPASDSGIPWDEAENLRFEYHYNFMPAGILSRLMVRLHELLKNENYWRYGLALTYKNCDALVKAEPFNRKITVRLRGVNKGEFLNNIRFEIDIIHGTLNNPDVKEMVQCNCSECMKTNAKPNLFLYNVLRQYEAEGRRTIDCTNGKIKEVEVLSLLRDVPMTKKEKEEQEAKEIRRGDTYNFYGDKNTVQAHTEMSIIDQSEHELQVTKQPEEPPMKKWYQKTWVIIVGLGTILGILASISKITGFSLKDIFHW